MITRVGDHVQMRQHDEHAPNNRSNLSATPNVTLDRPLDISDLDDQNSFSFETGRFEAADSFSLELEDLWNMVISSDPWMSQDIVATGDSANTAS